ncbi:hypothetical protein [Pseudomonas gingeri]|uniref:hypothetical protein n=1 Tax=Pseudomonas gingeri TaxID=117681 RepID=UPI0021098199|nr:hypothetical protein [Pseudomonas gingeri]
MTGNKAVEIVESFWREVWQKQDPQAAARFVSEDFVITSGGDRCRRPRGVYRMDRRIPGENRRLRFRQHRDLPECRRHPRGFALGT